MRIFLDENMARGVARALSAAGHDVISAAGFASGADDQEIWAIARRENRVLITFDKDFGDLTRSFGVTPTSGVILLRVPAMKSANLGAFLVKTIASRSDWIGSYCVIEPNRVRIRS